MAEFAGDRQTCREEEEGMVKNTNKGKGKKPTRPLPKDSWSVSDPQKANALERKFPCDTGYFVNPTLAATLPAWLLFRHKSRKHLLSRKSTQGRWECYHGDGSMVKSYH
jgi:hypothetical protein